ncbi:hypothetical protein [Pseudomonas sp.]|uniref:hypothetical protein n=1 Tax=Pseudomonas sp. TaxID=306 RepID=UPI002613D9AB|nr:hypothetical protein [Pseudomonas sp.]
MSQTELEMELKAWRLLLEDDVYRLDFPQDYYDTLCARADELLTREWINRDDWQLLHEAAQQAYTFTVEMLERDRRDCLDLKRLRLPGVA